MDESKLEELFRDSVQSVPPASFDEHDVARASRRITARRRMTAVGGTVVAAGVLAGGVALVVPSEQKTVTSQAQPEVASPRSDDGPSVMSTRGGRCGPDAQLAAAVTKELPEAAATAPVATPSCPSGAKVASFVLNEGPAAGNVTVIVSPVGTVPPDQAAPGDTRRPDGSEQSVRATRSGKLVIARSNPNQGSPAAPYGARLPEIAGAVATQF
ncbi:hypothetical protein [Saccharopolyspora oryzae]|uniref:Uncharacterized protein n=1 Tax=Saccharopolyspora oryzae TaxID=2997343 RepID=A0ABT4V7C4_9PSEU|nr:hypothetical protein [Saccharopolyspora oryzae]MDA3629876.1 hypothetical protein [Saccharopolyspora oryzae]